jgi:acetylornithine deacetylase
VYGPGDLAVAHSADEWVEVEELATAARTYVEAALHLGD